MASYKLNKQKKSILFSKSTHPLAYGPK